MKPSHKFKLEEYEWTMHSMGIPIVYDAWRIRRVDDDKVIKTFDDYLQALIYLEQLEDRAWLVS